MPWDPPDVFETNIDPAEWAKILASAKGRMTSTELDALTLAVKEANAKEAAGFAVFDAWVGAAVAFIPLIGALKAAKDALS